MELSVVGIGADGWPGLGERGRALLGSARSVVGAPRQLGLLPESVEAERVPLPSPLRERLPALIRGLDGPVAVLASGDPLLSGIGSTVIDVVGPVEIVPHISSVALARAAMGWSAESSDWVSLVGRDPHLLMRLVAPGARLLVLGSDGSTARAVAAMLTETGYGASQLTVLSNLGAADETRSQHLAGSFGDLATPPLTIVAVECIGFHALGWVAGLPDDAYEHDGQLTKRDARASALARLAPRPGELLWDVGAGAGSVAIEWMRAHPSCRAVAVERDPARADRIERNAARLGVPGLRVVRGEAPSALDALDRPDAIFIGGGASAPDLLDLCWGALQPGGRLVVHGVTIQTEALLGIRHGQIGGELTRLCVERAEPIGSFTGWRPARSITQWAATRI